MTVTLNTLTVAGLMTRINNVRNENNDDYLDDTKILHYLNDAIDELNLDDDFVGNKKAVSYPINTSTTRFYLFSTIFTDLDLDHIDLIRFDDDYARDYSLEQGSDYVLEPNPSGTGQGIRFISDINDTLQFLYYGYIPAVTASTDTIELPYVSNPYFINKVLQYVYESEHKYDVSKLYAGKSDTIMEKLRANNMYEYDKSLSPHPGFQHG